MIGATTQTRLFVDNVAFDTVDTDCKQKRTVRFDKECQREVIAVVTIADEFSLYSVFIRDSRDEFDSRNAGWKTPLFA